MEGVLFLVGVAFLVALIINISINVQENDTEELCESLRYYLGCINNFRREYIFQIFRSIKKHESVLHTKYAQLVVADDYGYFRYEDFIKELDFFAKSVVLNKEIIDPLNNDELLKVYSDCEKLVSKSLYSGCDRLVDAYGVLLADFFNFSLSRCTFDTYNPDKVIRIENQLFDILSDIYSVKLKQTDDVRRRILYGIAPWEHKSLRLQQARMDNYRELNVCYVVEELVFQLLVPSWEKTIVSNEELTPLDYEKNIANKLKQLGFNARTTKSTGDQGADVLASKDGVSFAIQCKMYSKPVGNKAVQEANAGRDFYKKDYGVVVSNAGFTKSARQAAHACGIILLNDNQLDDLLEYVKPERE